ncbi:hypothetical protein TIFTF001_016386 [Ficus carica]|uniref:Uncharacterized protein n=1 Tax=Ficus carica TaxID=3494 RepID=A0AA88ANI2_FICCA|nr:hypothetical protein TIFTF001_016386 [Ficus carica]
MRSIATLSDLRRGRWWRGWQWSRCLQRPLEHDRHLQRPTRRLRCHHCRVLRHGPLGGDHLRLRRRRGSDLQQDRRRLPAVSPNHHLEILTAVGEWYSRTIEGMHLDFADSRQMFSVF